jgi:hypothetical protein
MAVPMRRLAAPPAHFLFDLGGHDPLQDRQAQLGNEAFDVVARSGDQFLQGQGHFQTQAFIINGFFFGFRAITAIGFHGWFSWLMVSVFNRPSCLMVGRRTTSNSNYRRDISPRTDFGSSSLGTPPILALACLNLGTDHELAAP